TVGATVDDGGGAVIDVGRGASEAVVSSVATSSPERPSRKATAATATSRATTRTATIAVIARLPDPPPSSDPGAPLGATGVDCWVGGYHLPSEACHHPDPSLMSRPVLRRSALVCGRAYPGAPDQSTGWTPRRCCWARAA